MLADLAPWAALAATVLALLAVDLRVFARRGAEPSFRAAAGWSLAAVVGVLGVGVAASLLTGERRGGLREGPAGA